MPDKKISQLTAATTPLAGTEVAPIVQGGETKKVAVSEFVNSQTTFTRLQTQNGSSATPVTEDGFIFQRTSSAGRAGLKFTNRVANNGSQTLEAWSSDTSNTYAMRWRIDESANYQWGPGSQFTYSYGNFSVGQSNHYKISAGNNGLGFATDTNTQWLNFFNLNALSSPNNIARVEVTATSVTNNAEAGYLSIYTRSGAAGTAPLETAKFNANGDITASRGNVVMATAGKGIDFSANTAAPGATSELLTWYEEGTWTPTLGGTWSVNPINMAGSYTRIGNTVYLQLEFTGGTKATTLSGWFTGVPFNIGKRGTGAVVDDSVTAKGSALFANTNRVWVTENAFSGGNFLTGFYFV